MIAKAINKACRDTITDAYVNYLLDDKYPIEARPIFLYSLVQEPIVKREDMRIKKVRSDKARAF